MDARLVTGPLALAFICGCGQLGLKGVELDGKQDQEKQLQLTEQKDVDILFVIDNSGSMGEEQANLAANFGAFIEVLEAQDVGANYRIGVTTTDMGNPWCGATTPEGGNLVLSSCRERLGDFVFADDDVGELACTDICTLDAAELEVLPTATEYDASLAPRPWLERIEGKTNLAAGVSTVDAFRCFGPQGINGCGFESPLQAMSFALRRADTAGEQQYGFLRDSAILAVVIVTDEVDCSYNTDFSGIFTGEQGKVFWSDPEAEGPTSALCWNAGVECFGDPSGYDSCDSVDLDVMGNPTNDPDQAVLHPVGNYIDLLQQIEDEKRALNPDQDVIVALIGGVQPDGSLIYADVGETDPEFQANFGIGPGCTGSLGEAAVPPVRVRELVDAFTPGNLHSICAPDYTGALESIADKIRTKIIPACYHSCAADRDPETEILEPDCRVEMSLPGSGVVSVPECVRGEQGSYAVDPASGSYVLPGDDVDVCYAARVDADMLTPDPLDDISPYCFERGLNLEFELAYRSNVVLPADRSLSATCKVSGEPEVDCS